MGISSMTASDLHAKYRRPPERCSDLPGGHITVLLIVGFDAES
jgi:hypothetical protein